MGDTLKGAYIVFDQDYHVDDAEKIIEAIKMIKGVVDVQPNITNVNDWMNRRRIESEIQLKLLDVVTKKDKKS